MPCRAGSQFAFRRVDLKCLLCVFLLAAPARLPLQQCEVGVGRVSRSDAACARIIAARNVQRMTSCGRCCR